MDQATLIKRLMATFLEELEEHIQALRQHFARDAKVALDLIEARDADPDVSQDEWRPRLTDDVEGARDRARHVTEVGPLHHLSIVGCLKERTLIVSIS